MENIEEKKIKPRKAILAFLLSVLVPGFGQFYNGQLKKALFIFLGLLIYVICINLTGVKSLFLMYCAAFIILFILRLFFAIEATVIARKSKEYELKGYNKWYIYLLIIVLGYLTSSIVENIASNSRYIFSIIRSNSGLPNVFIGDYVLGDYRIYNSQEPTYGDLAVISSTLDGESYVFRVIGLPNDTLILENQLVQYKNKETSAKKTSILLYEEYEMEEFTGTLPNGVEYKFLRKKIPSFQDNDTFKEIIVPNNSYFLLGDNRDFSFDSRFIGFIQREQIKGKLLSTYFSKDLKRINKSLYENK